MECFTEQVTLVSRSDLRISTATLCQFTDATPFLMIIRKYLLLKNSIPWMFVIKLCVLFLWFVACGSLYNGSLHVSFQPAATMTGSQLDYNQCCSTCSANASCEAVSYLPGNSSSAGECLLFSIQPSETDLAVVARDSDTGWVTAVVISRRTL